MLITYYSTHAHAIPLQFVHYNITDPSTSRITETVTNASMAKTKLKTYKQGHFNKHS